MKNEFSKENKILVRICLVIFAISFFIHMYLLGIDSITGDDLFFSVSSENQNLINYLTWRWGTWSSRVVIEGVMILILKLPGFVWAILDSCVCVLLFYSVLKIINGKNDIQKLLIVSVLFIVFPFRYFLSAGRYATTLNYLWPLSFCLYSLSCMKECILGNRIPFWKKILNMCFLVYATNQEQICALTLGISFCSMIYYYYKNKKVNHFLLLYLVVSIVAMISIAFCPGNAIRTVSEISNWYPQFSEYSILDKFFLGVLSTFSFIASSKVVYFHLFILCLAWLSYRKKDKISMILIQIPLLTLLFGNYLFIFDSNLNSQNVVKSFMDNISGAVITKESIIYLICIFIVIFCIVFALFRVLKLQEAIFVFLIFSAALCERFIMGASPTIFASGTRTYINTYLLMLILDAILISMIKTKEGNKKI